MHPQSWTRPTVSISRAFPDAARYSSRRRPSFVVSLHPVFPVLARGAILAAEFKRGNLRIAQLALFRRVRSEVLHPGIGQRWPGLAIEDVGLDALSILERDGHVTAIVERLFKSLREGLRRSPVRASSLRDSRAPCREQVRALPPAPRVFQNFGGSCAGLLAGAGACVRSGPASCGCMGAGSLSRFSACWSG